jgi:hypothetical protein
MANKKVLAAMLALKDKKDFRKKDLKMAGSLVAGAASAKARDDEHGTMDSPSRPGVRIPKVEGAAPKPDEASKTLAKRRVRRSGY